MKKMSRVTKNIFKVEKTSDFKAFNLSFDGKKHYPQNEQNHIKMCCKLSVYILVIQGGDSVLKSLTEASAWMTWVFIQPKCPVLHNGPYTKPVIRSEIYHSEYQKPLLPYHHHGDE